MDHSCGPRGSRADLTANACPSPAGATEDRPSPAAIREIPPQLLPTYQQVGAHFDIPWEVLAGIGTEECSQGRLPDPSCALQPGATGPGIANSAGASGPMQIVIGEAAGDAYDPLRQYLPNPALGPHDPITAVELAALVLIRNKGAPTRQPVDTYLPYARAYNGTGAAADAYAARVIADAHSYQGSGQTTLVGETTAYAAAPSGAGYVNPFAHAQVTPSPIDQGVDYSGTGPITALGAGRVVLVSTTDSGWGIAHSVYHEGADSAAGRTMNQLLVSLGAQSGHRDATSCGGACPTVEGPTPSTPATPPTVRAVWAPGEYWATCAG